MIENYAKSEPDFTYLISESFSSLFDDCSERPFFLNCKNFNNVAFIFNLSEFKLHNYESQSKLV